MWQGILKRTIDVVGAVVGLIVFSPVFYVAVLLVKFDGTGGPVFCDAPRRVGLGGRKFLMWKFRTMVPNAYEQLMNDPKLAKSLKKQKRASKLKIHEDPRLTRVGRFLRRWDIDEIPQFINILNGEMSLVGPRPYFEHEFKYKNRKLVARVLSIKPGLTGLWQVSGRNDISLTKRIKIDAHYAETCSLLGDLKIILKTPYVVISRKGAW